MLEHDHACAVAALLTGDPAVGLGMFAGAVMRVVEHRCRRILSAERSVIEAAPGDELEFRPIGLDRAHWANANRVRTIFREACASAGLPYFNPHSFRSTVVQLAYERKLDAERFKAWSQNLGHDNCLTTFSSYGELLPARQGEIIRGLAKQGDAPAARCHSTSSGCLKCVVGRH